MKKVKNLFKKIGSFYLNSYNQTYGLCIKYGVNPFI